jgi:hypothetical protein
MGVSGRSEWQWCREEQRDVTVRELLENRRAAPRRTLLAANQTLGRRAGCARSAMSVKEIVHEWRWL